MNIIPFSGWALARILALDESYPGTAGHMFRASAERRQIIASFLAAEKPQRTFNSDCEVGRFLVHANHDAILSAVWKEVPPGLRGALGRSGKTPHEKRFYFYIHALLSSADVTIIKVVGRLHVIDLDRLRVLRALPVMLRRGNITATLTNVSDARDLGMFVASMIEQGVDADTMVTAFAAATDRQDITRVARRWVLKARLPDHPVPASEAYHPITTGEELGRTALQHHNCMRTYVANVLERRSSFATFRHGGKEGVVHLIWSDDAWRLDRVYGTWPGPAGMKLKREAEAYLARHGVGRRPRHTIKRTLDPIRRITGYHDPESDEE